MKKMLLALGALIASAAFVPAAQADDCDPDDGAVEFAKCLAGKKLPGLGQILPPMRPPVAIGKDCDPDDDDFKACMRDMKLPGMRQGMSSGQAIPSEMRPKADVRQFRDDNKVAGGKVEPPASPEASSMKAAGEVTDGPVCTRFLPNLGKSVVIPCSQ